MSRHAAPLVPPDGFPETDQGFKPINNETNPSAAAREVNDKGKGVNQGSPTSQPKASSATCIPKAAERIKVDLPSHRINNEIQFMQDHALIGKFLGFWPTEKALQGWIASKWKPKGQVTLQLGPKASSRPFSIVWRTNLAYSKVALTSLTPQVYTFVTGKPGLTQIRNISLGLQFGYVCTPFLWNTGKRKR